MMNEQPREELFDVIRVSLIFSKQESIPVASPVIEAIIRVSSEDGNPFMGNRKSREPPASFIESELGTAPPQSGIRPG